MSVSWSKMRSGYAMKAERRPQFFLIATIDGESSALEHMDVSFYTMVGDPLLDWNDQNSQCAYYFGS